MGDIVKLPGRTDILCCSECDGIVFHWYSNKTLMCVMCGAIYGFDGAD